MKKNKNTYESYNETVEEFKNSFFYGSRNNLFFKYLGGKNIVEVFLKVKLRKFENDEEVAARQLKSQLEALAAIDEARVYVDVNF